LKTRKELFVWKLSGTGSHEWEMEEKVAMSQKTESGRKKKKKDYIMMINTENIHWALITILSALLALFHLQSPNCEVDSTVSFIL
jgi:hypothetical protein